MFSHNLKIALRNLAKYKLQTTISVLSIAIGIVSLAVVHSYVQTQLTLPPLYTTPHFDRVYSLHLMKLDSLQSEEQDEDFGFNGEALRAVKAGGKLHSVEGELIFCSQIFPTRESHFSLGDSLERVSEEGVLPVEVSYPNYAGYVSAITGKPIAKLRPGEVIISELRAREIFGDLNPVGAVLTQKIWSSGERVNLTFTVADVYANPGRNGWPRPTTMMYAIDEAEIGRNGENDYTQWLTHVVLKEGCTPEQLEQEINPRLAPLGWKVKADWLKEARAGMIQRINTMRALGYLMGVLILLAACIGFLRMQLQLFRMRRRELSLRIVNGAKQRNLFSLLMTEVAVVLLASVGVALLFGSWLEPFINTLYENTGDAMDIRTVNHLLTYSAIIGALLLLLLAAVVWFALKNICRSAYNLAEGMRGERSHTFRNVMLGLQITVGMLFVSVALFIASLSEVLSQAYVLPEDDRRYRESILVTSDEVENLPALNDALQTMPDVAQMISYDVFFPEFEEVQRNDSLQKKLEWARSIHRGIQTADTAYIDYFNVQTTWLRPELKGKECMLLQEEMYAELDSTGVLANGVLTWGRQPIPIAGTFKDVELNERKGWGHYKFIFIDPEYVRYCGQNILIPKPGKYGALWNEVEAAVARIAPTLVQRVVFNLYDKEGAQIELLSNERKAGWILGAVALLVCMMGIYSTIVLDTRARRKEMAIRKINGAKPKDIALIFARLYILLTLLGVLVTIPLAFVLQHYYLEANYYVDELKDYLPTVRLVFTGCLAVILSIALIVGWQVRSIMRINPAEMVAKE